MRIMATGREVDRLVFFSDAVFAIAMTLLAVGIRVPTVPDDQVGAAIRRVGGPIAGYFLTFAVIGLYWMAHHRIFRFIRQIDSVLIALNLVLLSLIALMPVPSDLLGRSSSSAAVVFYAVAVALVGLSATAVWLYAAVGHRLIDPDVPDAVVTGTAIRSVTAPVVFTLSIPLALVNPHLAMYSWLLLIPLGVLATRWMRSRAPAGG